MTTPKNVRRSLLARIHIARKQLGMDEATYRAMLFNLTGRESARDCTDGQLERVAGAFARRGFKDTRPKAPTVRLEMRAMLGKLNALRLDTKTSWAYVESIAKTMYGLGLSWLDETQMRGVITAMVKHQQRQKAAQCGEGC